MTNLDLRPLSLGEILDRTFSLYRRHFVLFLGITALPHLLVLALNLAETLVTQFPAVPTLSPVEQLQARSASGLLAFGIVGVFVGLLVYLVAYLFAQGGTVFAVSELYLGRQTSIGASLSRMRGQLGSLFGVILLNGLAVMGAALFLIIPGIYVACRLITCVPAALLEDLGPRASLERSFRLTKDSAGRAFVIFLLYFIMLYAAILLFMFPFLFMAGLSAKDPGMMRMWLSLGQVGNFVAGVLVSPFLTIATAVFYYDLRVRKEAFDLQVMMNPSGTIPTGSAGVPTMLS
jgi:hypothetical protein